MKRSIVAQAAESVMAAGVRLLPVSRLRGQVLILTYHDILAPGAEPVHYNALRLPVERFEEHLDAVRDRFEVISLTDALAGYRAPNAEPAVVITFDDAYIGAVRHGVAALRKRDLPATIFVAPGFCSGRAFWWDSLSDSGSEVPVADIRGLALSVLEGRSNLIERWAFENGIALRSSSEEYRSATEPELHEALRYERLTFGSHTWNHPNMAVLAEDAIRNECEMSLAWIRRFGSRAVPYLAYPYGLSSALARELASAAGYAGALDLAGGWFSPAQADPFQVPRRNIPAAVSRPGFALRLAGFPRL